MNSLADAIVMQNLSVLTRGNTLKPQGAAARRAEHVPAVPPGVLAPAHPRDLGRARLRLPEGRADRGADLRPRERAVLRRVRRGAVRPLRGRRRSARYTRPRSRSTSSSTHGRKARLGETRRPAARRGRASELDDVPRARTRSRSSRRRDARARARSSRGVIGLDGGSTSSKAVLIDDETASILQKAYQLSKGNPIQDTKELLARAARRASTDQGATLEVHRLRRDRLRRRRARGVVSRRREHRRDRRAHDARDALLRRRRRHLRHRRAGHQGPVHAERRHQELPPVEPVLGRQRHAAAGDGRSVRRPGHRVRRRRVRGRARAEVQLRLRRLPRHRPRELPEGGLLEGGAARRPRAGAAEERLAVRRADPAPGGARARSSCCRAARSTTSPRSRRRSTTSRSACPDAEVFVHPHTRRGRRDRRRDRDAARGQAQGPARRSSASMPRSTSSTRRRTTRRRAATSARTTARARSSTPRRPTAAPSRYISGFSCEKGTVESEEAMLALAKERKKLMKQFPNLVDYEAKRAFRHFYEPAPMPEARHADQGHRGQEGASSASSAAARSTRPFQRSSDGGVGEAPPTSASASRACSTSTRRRRSSARTSRRSASRSRTSSSPTRRPRRCGSRAASTARSIPCYPSQGRAGAHPQPAVPPAHRRRSRSTTSSSRSSRTCRPSSTNAMDNASLPDRRRHAQRHEGGVHEGDRLLRRARHRATSTRRSRFTEPTLLQAAHVRDLGPAARHHRGRERLRLPARRWKALDIVRRTTCRTRAARSSRRSRRRTASRS